jgi:hypothetical protein
MVMPTEVRTGEEGKFFVVDIDLLLDIACCMNFPTLAPKGNGSEQNGWYGEIK